MFAEKKEGTGKKNKGKVVIGYDLSDTYAQISYYETGKEEAETLAVVTGTEQFNIPMVLCKRKEVNQWFFGKEAIRFAEEEGGIRVENLLSLAREADPVDVGGESFDPVALLTLFVRRSLSLLGMVAVPDDLDGVMFTVDDLDGRMVEVLSQVAVNLHLRTERIHFQSHVESFYYYILHQPEELWTGEVLLCDYDYRRLKLYSLACNRKTTPRVIYIDVDEHEEMDMQEAAEGGMDEPGKRRMDELFLDCLRKKCGGHTISCAYLIGEGYKEEWASESLRYLCRGRRVFQGNNLYSKGACYGICEKLGMKELAAEYVFLGLDKLKANIGMKVLKRGVDSYYAVMDAGVNWFEAKKEFEVILESGDTVSVMLTPLNGKEPREINMIMEDIAQRPEWTTRLKVAMEMLSENRLSVRVKDMGFGEFFPASGGEWIKVFEV